MTTPLQSLFLLLALSLMSGARIQAAPVDFPDEEPAFTIEAPKGWEAKVLPPDSVSLSTGTGKDMVMAIFSTADEATDMATAKVYLEALGEAIAPNFGLKDLKASAPAAEIPLNGKVNAVAQEFQGKTPPGDDAVLTMALFTADGKKFYSMIIVGTKKRTQATNDDQTAIMKSITPK